VTILAWLCLASAATPALLYLWNSFLFRPAPPADDGPAPTLSVLIPARDEEQSITACVESVLASRGVELEVIVLDDHSTDRTAELVRGLSARDPRVRVETAPPLPEGWSGKQHACFTLARLARYDLLAFLDADVRVAPDGLARLAAFQRQSGSQLVSGFPHQETGTVLEKLVIPLIHWVLLGWLPFWGMRRVRWPALSAGCGQLFLTTRSAYEVVGGHSAVKHSLHDGITLPRAYRRAGFRTDVCDATDLATCRMYRSASDVWYGLAKNAREGLAENRQIGFWTMVFFCGQVLPVPLLLYDPAHTALWASAVALSYLPRLHALWRFRQSLIGALLHPVGILILLAIQWYAVGRAILGKPVGWKGRDHPSLTSGGSPQLT